MGISTYPEIVAAVDIPLDQVAVALGKERLEAVLVGNIAALLVAELFVLLVMAMSRVELKGGTC